MTTGSDEYEVGPPPRSIDERARVRWCLDNDVLPGRCTTTPWWPSYWERRPRREHAGYHAVDDKQLARDQALDAEDLLSDWGFRLGAAVPAVGHADLGWSAGFRHAKLPAGWGKREGLPADGHAAGEIWIVDDRGIGRAQVVADTASPTMHIIDPYTAIAEDLAAGVLDGPWDQLNKVEHADVADALGGRGPAILDAVRAAVAGSGHQEATASLLDALDAVEAR